MPGLSNRIRIFTSQNHKAQRAQPGSQSPTPAHSSSKTSCIASESFPFIDIVGERVGRMSLFDFTEA